MIIRNGDLVISSFIGDHSKDIAHATAKAARQAQLDAILFLHSMYPYWQGIAVLYCRNHDDWFLYIVLFRFIIVLSFFITIKILLCCTNWYAFHDFHLIVMCREQCGGNHLFKVILWETDFPFGMLNFQGLFWKLPGVYSLLHPSLSHMHLLSLVQAPPLQLPIVRLPLRCLQGALDEGNWGIKTKDDVLVPPLQSSIAWLEITIFWLGNTSMNGTTITCQLQMSDALWWVVQSEIQHGTWCNTSAWMRFKIYPPQTLQCNAPCHAWSIPCELCGHVECWHVSRFVQVKSHLASSQLACLSKPRWRT